MGVSDARGPKSILHYTLAENDELDITDNGNAAPCHRGRPQGCMVGDAAGDCGEMRVG